MPFTHLRTVATLLGVTALSAFGVVESCSRSAAEGPRTMRAFSPMIDAPPALPEITVPRPDPKRLPKLSPKLPADLDRSASVAGDLDSDNAAASFAWDTFIALNWPARPDGEADQEQLPGVQGDNATVWESWPEASEIFLPDGRPPAPWGSPAAAEARPAILRDLPAETRILIRTGKGLSSMIPGMPAGPLIDQNGRHVRLETRVNRPVFDTILSQRLYRRDAQASAGPVSFPAGQTDATENTPGAIRVQACWKILSPAEIAAGRFHAVQAVLYTPPANPGTERGLVEHATVGLVGLHVVRKTPSAPGWVWATFEHVDNCPTWGEPADRADYNFYDKTAPDRPTNLPPAPPWDPAAIEPVSRRSQIVRQIPIPVSTRALSAAYQAALRAINPASPWQYYELVGVQLSGAGGTPPTPEHLVNTTLEPYLATSATPAASCIDCHAKATTASGAPADSSFLFRLAQ